MSETEADGVASTSVSTAALSVVIEDDGAGCSCDAVCSPSIATGGKFGMVAVLLIFEHKSADNL